MGPDGPHHGGHRGEEPRHLGGSGIEIIISDQETEMVKKCFRIRSSEEYAH